MQTYATICIFWEFSVEKRVKAWKSKLPIRYDLQSASNNVSVSVFFGLWEKSGSIIKLKIQLICLLFLVEYTQLQFLFDFWRISLKNKKWEIRISFFTFFPNLDRSRRNLSFNTEYFFRRIFSELHQPKWCTRSLTYSSKCLEF